LFVRAKYQCEGEIPEKHTSYFQVDDSKQLQQEPKALQAEQTEHDSLQDLTGFCKYLLC
jgi:hypothetical protein